MAVSPSQALDEALSFVFGSHGVTINSPHAVGLLASLSREHRHAQDTLSQTIAAISSATLGLIFFDGFGIGVDEERGKRWANLAVQKYKIEELTTLDWITDRENAVDLVGLVQFIFGRMLKSGCGVPRDHTRAVEMFRNAISRNVRFSYSVLGVMMVFGTGVDKDNDTAAKLFQDGALRGDAYAIRNMGWMSLHGLGFETDEQRAIDLFHRAVDAGQPEALVNLGYSQAQNAHDSKYRFDKVECYSRAATYGLAIAMYNLSRIALDRNHPCYNIRTGVLLLEKAAQQNQPWALLELGRIHLRSGVWERHSATEFVPKDEERGRQLIQLAANRGHEPAVRFLQTLGVQPEPFV